MNTRLAEMFNVKQLPVSPEKQIGPHCGNPYPCPLHDHCWRFLPDANVTELYRGKAKGFEFLQQGIMGMADIPSDDGLTDNQSFSGRSRAQASRMSIVRR